MVTDGDRAFAELLRIEVPEIQRCRFFPLHAELLIEIAIVHLATPTNAQGITTHEACDRSRIEGFGQQFHVGAQFSTMSQPGSKAPDRHICDGVKPMEIDVEMLLQLPFIVRLQFRLAGWKKVTIGIVDEIKDKIRRPPVAKAVQEWKGAYPEVEDAVAALGIHVFRSVTWHRGDNIEAMGNQKFGEPVKAGFKQNREVAAIDNGFDLRHLPEPLDQIAKIGNHFRRAAGQVHGRNVGVYQPVEDSVDGRARDDFFAFWSGVHVAVNAGEVAKLAHVELEDLGATALESQSVIRQCAGKGLTGWAIEVRRECHFQMAASYSGCYLDGCEAGDNTNYATGADRRQVIKAQSTCGYGTFADKVPTDRDAGEGTRAVDPES